jgi:hypothetical protein
MGLDILSEIDEIRYKKSDLCKEFLLEMHYRKIGSFSSVHCERFSGLSESDISEFYCSYSGLHGAGLSNYASAKCDFCLF